MRHKKAGVKLGRSSSHRDAMFRNMVTSLLKHDRIHTTDVKAKELRRWVEKIITLAKRGDLNARRQALAIVREKDVVHKLFEQAQERFGHLNGGYSRVVKIGTRPGDAASMSLIELIAAEPKAKKGRKKKSPAAKPETPPPAAAAPPVEPSEAREEQEAHAPEAKEAAAPEAPEDQPAPESYQPSEQGEEKK